MSLADLIRGKTDWTPQPVATPEWPEADGKLAVRRLRPQERSDFFAVCRKYEAFQFPAFGAMVVAFCAVDVSEPTAPGASLKRAFSDDDFKWLAEEPGSVLDRIVAVADDLNILSDGAQERLRKNSERPQSSEPT